MWAGGTGSSLQPRLGWGGTHIFYVSPAPGPPPFSTHGTGVGWGKPWHCFGICVTACTDHDFFFLLFFFFFFLLARYFYNKSGKSCVWVALRAVTVWWGGQQQLVVFLEGVHPVLQQREKEEER